MTGGPILDLVGVWTVILGAAVFLALSLLAQLGEQAIGNETADERT